MKSWIRIFFEGKRELRARLAAKDEECRLLGEALKAERARGRITVAAVPAEQCAQAVRTLAALGATHEVVRAVDTVLNFEILAASSEAMSPALPEAEVRFLLGGAERVARVKARLWEKLRERKP